MNKRKIKIIIAIAVATVILASILTFLLLNNKKDEVKIDNIAMNYGENFSTSFIIEHSDKYTFEIQDTSIAIIENNIIKPQNFGTTILNIYKDKTIIAKIPINIEIKTLSFNSENITLHINGRDTTSELMLLANGLPYLNTHIIIQDESIVSYNESTITAKKVGSTKISATVVNGDNILSARCNVVVKNYVFVENIIDEPIFLNINQEKPYDFITFTATDGEKLYPKFIYNEDYLTFDNNKITAKKLGTTTVTVKATLASFEEIEKAIVFVISPELELTNCCITQNGETISKIMYGKKFDSTYTVYNLQLNYNKPLMTNPTFDGIDNVVTKTSDEQNYSVSFTKSNNDRILIHSKDSNTNKTITTSISIEMQEYIQEIVYTLTTSNGTHTTNVYIYNETYSQDANNENYFNSLRLTTSNSVSASIEGDCVELQNNIISAKIEGTAVLKLTATDGSNCYKTITINSNIIKATAIEFKKISDVFLLNKFDLTPKITPVYAKTDFSIEFDNDVFTQNDFSFIPNKITENSSIKIKDNISTFSHMFSISILQEYIFIYKYNIVEEITITKGIPVMIEIRHKLSKEEDDYNTDFSSVSIDFDSRLTKNEKNNEYTITAKENGTFLIRIIKDNITVAQLIIKVE